MSTSVTSAPGATGSSVSNKPVVVTTDVSSMFKTTSINIKKLAGGSDWISGHPVKCLNADTSELWRQGTPTRHAGRQGRSNRLADMEDATAVRDMPPTILSPRLIANHEAVNMPPT